MTSPRTSTNITSLILQANNFKYVVNRNIGSIKAIKNSILLKHHYFVIKLWVSIGVDWLGYFSVVFASYVDSFAACSECAGFKQNNYQIIPPSLKIACEMQ